jgi:hypothetical protein
MGIRSVGMKMDVAVIYVKKRRETTCASIVIVGG